MKVSAEIELERSRIEAILGDWNGAGSPSLKKSASADFGLELEWLDEKRISVVGSMRSITLLVEEWRPSAFSLTSFTEDDEL
jgi:hypothetical protein